MNIASGRMRAIKPLCGVSEAPSPSSKGGSDHVGRCAGSGFHVGVRPSDRVVGT